MRLLVIVDSLNLFLCDFATIIQASLPPARHHYYRTASHSGGGTVDDADITRRPSLSRGIPPHTEEGRVQYEHRMTPAKKTVCTSV